jgi:hypothetical protein
LFQREWVIWVSKSLIDYLGNLMKESKFTGILARQDWMS